MPVGMPREVHGVITTATPLRGTACGSPRPAAIAPASSPSWLAGAPVEADALAAVVRRSRSPRTRRRRPDPRLAGSTTSRAAIATLRSRSQPRLGNNTAAARAGVAAHASNASAAAANRGVGLARPHDADGPTPARCARVDRLDHRRRRDLAAADQRGMSNGRRLDAGDGGRHGLDRQARRHSAPLRAVGRELGREVVGRGLGLQRRDVAGRGGAAGTLSAFPRRSGGVRSSRRGVSSSRRTR